MNFMVVFRKEMQEQWRTYRFLIVAAVFTAFGLARHCWLNSPPKCSKPSRGYRLNCYRPSPPRRWQMPSASMLRI